MCFIAFVDLYSAVQRSCNCCWYYCYYFITLYYVTLRIFFLNSKIEYDLILSHNFEDLLLWSYGVLHPFIRWSFQSFPMIFFLFFSFRHCMHFYTFFFFKVNISISLHLSLSLSVCLSLSLSHTHTHTHTHRISHTSNTSSIQLHPKKKLTNPVTTSERWGGEGGRGRKAVGVEWFVACNFRSCCHLS